MLHVTSLLNNETFDTHQMRHQTSIIPSSKTFYIIGTQTRDVTNFTNPIIFTHIFQIETFQFSNNYFFKQIFIFFFLLCIVM